MTKTTFTANNHFSCPACGCDAAIDRESVWYIGDGKITFDVTCPHCNTFIRIEGRVTITEYQEQGHQPVRVK